MLNKQLTFFITFLILCFSLVASPLPELYSEGAILIEPTTNTILYSKNSHSTFYPASTTKILSSLILIEDLPTDTLITKTSASIAHTPNDSSHIGLRVGDQYSALDGLYGILLGSDNFISYDMAVKDSGSIESFAKKMNKKALELGATSSHFINPHGYHSPDHYTTPYDLSQIARGAFSNDLLLKIAGTPTYNFSLQNKTSTIPLKHTALLLNPNNSLYNPSVIGVKTGFHDAAKRVLVAKAHYDNIDLIGVVMHTDAPHQFEDMNKLFAYGQANYSLATGDTPYVLNHSYSPWAEFYIKKALEKGWIPQTTRNYTTSISGREMVNLIKSSLPSAYRSILDECILYNGDSIYAENLPASRKQLTDCLLHFFHSLSLSSKETLAAKNGYLCTPDTCGEALLIQYLTNTQSLGKADATLSSHALLTYEEAIAITCNISELMNRYDQLKLVNDDYPYSLPLINLY